MFPGQSRENEKIQHHDHPTLQRNLSEDFERDAGSSLQETVVVETMDPNHNHNHHNPRTLGFGTLGSGAQTRTPVPVLNTRMKNLSQFSFRYRESDREQRVRVVQTTSRLINIIHDFMNSEINYIQSAGHVMRKRQFAARCSLHWPPWRPF